MNLEQVLFQYGFPSGSEIYFESVLMEGNQGPESLMDLQKEAEEEGIFRATVVSAFEKGLGLILDRGSRHNVCFANHEEVLPEFRTAFTENELLEYIFAFHPGAESGTKGECERLIRPYPADPDMFWKQVELGRKKKQQFK